MAGSIIRQGAHLSPGFGLIGRDRTERAADLLRLVSECHRDSAPQGDRLLCGLHEDGLGIDYFSGTAPAPAFFGSAISWETWLELAGHIDAAGLARIGWLTGAIPPLSAYAEVFRIITWGDIVLSASLEGEVLSTNSLEHFGIAGLGTYIKFRPNLKMLGIEEASRRQLILDNLNARETTSPAKVLEAALTLDDRRSTLRHCIVEKS